MRSLTSFTLCFVLASATLTIAGYQMPGQDIPPFGEDDVPLNPYVCGCEVETEFTSTGEPLPSCVGSFGITYSVSQEGRCSMGICQERPCIVAVSASITPAEGETCDPESTWIVVNQPEFDGENGGLVLFPDGEPVDLSLQIGCGYDDTIDWIIEGVPVGSTRISCLQCE